MRQSYAANRMRIVRQVRHSLNNAPIFGRFCHALVVGIMLGAKFTLHLKIDNPGDNSYACGDDSGLSQVWE